MTIEKSNATYLQQQPTLEERVRIFSRYRRMRQQQACTLQCDRVSKVVGRTDELVMVCGWHLRFICYSTNKYALFVVFVSPALLVYSFIQ